MPPKTWPLHEAKNRLSEVIDAALTTGPQAISRRGKEAVVVVSAEQYRRLLRPKQPLSAFLRGSPLKGVKLDLARSADAGRDVDL